MLSGPGAFRELTPQRPSHLSFVKTECPFIFVGNSFHIRSVVPCLRPLKKKKKLFSSFSKSMSLSNAGGAILQLVIVCMPRHISLVLAGSRKKSRILRFARLMARFKMTLAVLSIISSPDLKVSSVPLAFCVLHQSSRVSGWPRW